MKILMRAVVPFLLSLFLIAGAAVPASAASLKFDVTKLTAKSIVVKSWHCYNTTVSMAHKKSGVATWDVYTDITKSGRIVSDAWFSSDGNTKKAKATLCPSSNADYGKHRIGPSSVFGASKNWTKSVSRDDFTKGSFYVRAHVKTGLTTKRSGSKVTLTATAKRYSLDAWGYKSYSPKKAKFQVKTGSGWKTLKTVTLKKGKAKHTVKSKAKKTYRFVTVTTSTSAGSTSKAVRK